MRKNRAGNAARQLKDFLSTTSEEVTLPLFSKAGLIWNVRLEASCPQKNTKVLTQGSNQKQQSFSSSSVNLVSKQTWLTLTSYPCTTNWRKSTQLQVYNGTCCWSVRKSYQMHRVIKALMDLLQCVRRSQLVNVNSQNTSVIITLMPRWATTRP